jgi:monooxygenase
MPDASADRAASGPIAADGKTDAATVSTTPRRTAVTNPSARDLAGEHVDVLIVGAGLSGIGAAYRLQQQCPGRSYAVLEARKAVGGTWDLFRYPGVRSDSDIFTLSYPFRPWRDATSLADGASIREYIERTATEEGIREHIRFRTKVVDASWSSAEARWTVRTLVGEDAAPRTLTCSFLYVCAGYYDYDHGHQPDFAGVGDFHGRLVHPQLWPEDLDVDGQRIVVIGSGATAVTLVPALAGRAATVTMLQRTPSYVSALPAVDQAADALRRHLPAQLAHTLIRAKNVSIMQAFYQFCRRRPELAKRLLRKGLLQHLDDPAFLDEHFTPPYDPWDQRLCVTPEGDLLQAVAAGRADVVTDTIDRFVESGIRLSSGRTLEADVVVSATGLSLLPIGGMTLTVDGAPVALGERFAYRGMMLSGVPNLAFCVGYTNASWTLRADLVSQYVCRLLNHMARHDIAYGAPVAPPAETARPLLDLTSGYVQRAIDRFPKQGRRDPWTVRQNYLVDRVAMPRADVRRDMTFVARASLSAASAPPSAPLPASPASPQEGAVSR